MLKSIASMYGFNVASVERFEKQTPENSWTVSSKSKTQPEKKSKSDELKSLFLPTFGVVGSIGFLIFLPYYLVMFGLFIRVVMKAFQCGPGEGVSALLFYPLYKMWKFGSFVEASKSTGGFF
jgi:hypothetical protein